MSSKSGIAALAAVFAAAVACATQQQMLDQQQAAAVETALARGRFDLNCPAATGIVLSRDFIQPAIQGPWVSGIQRLEYTVGVEGCGQRTTIISICQEGSSSCFATNPDERFRRE